MRFWISSATHCTNSANFSVVDLTISVETAVDEAGGWSSLMVGGDARLHSR
ncbi:MAG: hypothetical protein HC832_06820 [Leptolyngbyaceae cyanobacterium RM1_405_57]|nr:hypothetical protein [Leptolyngbyaceae cyanobacterium RM1_405_57]